MHRRTFVGLVSAGLAGMPRQLAATPQPGGVRIRRLTWAGVQFQIGDEVLLVDPLLNPRNWQPAWTLPVVAIETGGARASALITHLHPDHFDIPGLTATLGTNGPVHCLGEKAPRIQGAGLRAVPHERFQSFDVGPWSITAVPAEDGNGEEQVSWVIAGGGRRFIHCGDTMWHGNWWRIGREYGPFDLAFLPINGANLVIRQPYVDIPASMTPDQAAAAAVVLRARQACPIHYGFEDPARLREFPNALPTFIERARARGVEPLVLEPGAHHALA